MGATSQNVAIRRFVWHRIPETIGCLVFELSKSKIKVKLFEGFLKGAAYTNQTEGVIGTILQKV